MSWMKSSTWVVSGLWCLVVAAGQACLLASGPPRVVSHAAGCPSQSATPVAHVVCQMIGAQQTLRSESTPRASVTINSHSSPVDAVRLSHRPSARPLSVIPATFRSDVHVRYLVLRL